MGHMVAPGLDGHSVLLAQAAIVHNTDNSVVLGKNWVGATVAPRFVGVFIVLLGEVARGNQGRQQGPPEECVHTTSTGAFAYVVAGDGFRHTCSGWDQDKPQALLPSMCSLVAVGTILSVCGCITSP